MKIFIVLAGVLLTVCSCSKKSIFTGEQSELILSGQVAFDGNTQPHASVFKSADGQLDPLPATDLGVYVLTMWERADRFYDDDVEKRVIHFGCVG